MSEPVRIFWCEESDQVDRWLRRYAPVGGGCSEGAYHNARVPFDRVTQAPGTYIEEPVDRPADDDPRWPVACACGYQFKAADPRQVFQKRVYRRTDTGALVPFDELPPGAVWNAWWAADHKAWTGPDGRCLVVRLPNGTDWMIDSRASNCGRPGDSVHKCWVRHGKPEDGTLHVDKDGDTCSAGAGSILAGDYHGFLRHGHLVSC